MSEPRGDHEAPMDADESMPEAGGPWHNVPRPTTEELLAPSAQVADPPSIPLVVKIVGILIVLVLLLLSVWLGLSLGRSGSVEPSPTASVDESLWALEPPVQVGSLVRGDVTTKPAESTGGREIITSTYTDGTDKVILLLSRPEDDLTSYLTYAGVSNAAPVEGSRGISCGISDDNKLPFCARVVDDTAIAVASLSEQDIPTLISLLGAFYEELQ